MSLKNSFNSNECAIPSLMSQKFPFSTTPHLVNYCACICKCPRPSFSRSPCPLLSRPHGIGMALPSSLSLGKPLVVEEKLSLSPSPNQNAARAPLLCFHPPKPVV